IVEDLLAIGIFGQRYPRPIRTTNGKRPHVPWRIWNPLRADRDDLVAVEVEVHGLIRVRKVQDLKPAKHYQVVRVQPHFFWRTHPETHASPAESPALRAQPS